LASESPPQWQRAGSRPEWIGGVFCRKGRFIPAKLLHPRDVPRQTADRGDEPQIPATATWHRGLTTCYASTVQSGHGETAARRAGARADAKTWVTMPSASLEIACLFADREAPSDLTGSLSICAEALQAMDPCLLLLADGDGAVIAVHDVGSGIHLDVAAELALCMAARLLGGDHRGCEFKFPTELGPRLAFAVRLPPDAEEAILGGLVRPSRRSHRRLDTLQSTLQVCGRLVWTAIRTKRVATEAQNRAKNLSSQQATLELSHAEATNDAILEREERIRQKLAHDARMNAVLKTAADGIIVTDDCGVIETFNAAAQTIFGYHAMEVVGKRLATLLPLLDEEAERGAELCRDPRSALGCSGDIRREVEGVRKDGSTCPLELAISTTCVEDQQLFTVLVRDITERKRAEEELRQLHLQNRMILNSAGEGIFGIDRHGCVIFANPAAAQTLGWRPEELIGKPHHATFYHTRRDAAPYPPEQSPIGKTIEDGTVRHNDTDLFWKRDGTSFPVQYTSTPLSDATGKILGAVVTFSDITERRMLEAQLAQAQKLESIGQLAAGIAHEINTPTQYIGDNARFLRGAFQEVQPLLAACSAVREGTRSRALGADDWQAIASSMEQADLPFLLKEIPAAIDQSLEGIERVAKIVRSMKEFSHPGTEEKQDVDINRAIENTLTISRNEWKYVAEAVTELAEDLPPVTCRPGDLNQVLLNLIVNAAHAIEAKLSGRSNERGVITVRTRQDGEWVEIDVQDTGTGIPEAIRAKVFDPFFTTKKVGRGTGQGLAIARTIVVQRHGGTIGFDTEVGRGTTFIVRIPISPGSSCNKGTDRETSHSVGG